MYRILIIFLFISSCSELNETNTNETNTNEINTNETNSNKIIEKKIPEDQNNEYSLYVVGDPYYINDILYIPKENYNYSEIGLASIYDVNSHGKKTTNNEIINVTKLIVGHKTLPLPSVVKITNVDNGTSLIARVNDRGPLNNEEIIIVSITIAKLLDFYDKKERNVKVEILTEESKQLKVVTESIRQSLDTNTISAAPTSNVSITTIDEK